MAGCVGGVPWLVALVVIRCWLVVLVIGPSGAGGVCWLVVLVVFVGWLAVLVIGTGRVGGVS